MKVWQVPPAAAMIFPSPAFIIPGIFPSVSVVHPGLHLNALLILSALTHNLPFKVQTESQFLGMFSLSTAYCSELLWFAVLHIVYVRLSYFLRFFESVMKTHLYVLKISILKKRKKKRKQNKSTSWILFTKNFY